MCVSDLGLRLPKWSIPEPDVNFPNMGRLYGASLGSRWCVREQVVRRRPLAGEALVRVSPSAIYASRRGSGTSLSSDTHDYQHLLSDDECVWGPEQARREVGEKNVLTHLHATIPPPWNFPICCPLAIMCVYLFLLFVTGRSRSVSRTLR